MRPVIPGRAQRVRPAWAGPMTGSGRERGIHNRRQGRCSQDEVVVMDSGLRAALGPGMTVRRAYFRTQITRTTEAFAASMPTAPAEAGGTFCASRKLRIASTGVSVAVAGFALGGGCELAMMCDVIIAADNAKFGQPEIKLGVIPGIGGTQRLTRAVGKAKAMDLNLTGRMMDAAEAERSGLVARVVPLASLMDEAMKAAETIAGMSLVALMTAKEAVNRAFETTLAEGIRFERRTFHALFATHDQKEGMAAFVEKRPPKFEDR